MTVAVNALDAALSTAGRKAREACDALLSRWLRRQDGVCNYTRNYLRWVVRHVCLHRGARWQHLLGDSQRRWRFVAVVVAVLDFPRGVAVMGGAVPAPADGPEAEAEAVALLRELWRTFPRTLHRAPSSVCRVCAPGSWSGPPCGC